MKLTLYAQFVALVFRAFFLLSAGKLGADALHFIGFRSADPGASIVAFIAFTMYIYQLKMKFKHADNPKFDYWALKLSLVRWFWLYMVLYAIYWGTFFAVSLD